ncbi:MAG: leucine--tRNA ligase, partial [Lachnospiraceae bacterium]|nr:leucine--tRNA ligase [Lachnospiraceae bacterium]
LAPDGDLVQQLLPRVKNRAEVEAYIEETRKKNDMDRTELNKGKTGCRLEGVKCINPVNGKEAELFIGDFVLASYGTGAVMAVPSHDQRDFEYAVAHNIEMIQVIDGNDKTGHIDVSGHALEKYDYLGKGYKLINSAEFTGMTVEEAKEAITVKLEKMGVAKRTVNYHFREWIFARQRYWGEPVPVVHTEDGGIHVLDDDELPLVLPELEDYKSKGGKAPLENATEWKKYDHNGIKGTRETSTMPGSAGSSWYFLRYIDPDNDKEFADYELLKHWMPVDLYIGGPEHAVGHLMYSRIWNRFLYDKGLSPVKEPFKKLVHQGMILGENGIKMGKRFPEFVVNPSDVVRDYGADTLRLYEMFMGPLEVSKPWSNQGVEGARRFLNRVWNFFTEKSNLTDTDDGELTQLYHQTVKKVTNDFEKLAFNTAISQMMIFVNALYKKGSCPLEYAKGIVKMLSCICPHIGEEIWEIIAATGKTIAFEPWPKYDENLAREDEIEIAIQINGKVKSTIKVGLTEEQDSVKARVWEDANIKRITEGKTVVKEIYVKGKIYTIVIK